jgi:hypothetical protein
MCKLQCTWQLLSSGVKCHIMWQIGTPAFKGTCCLHLQDHSSRLLQIVDGWLPCYISSHHKINYVIALVIYWVWLEVWKWYLLVFIDGIGIWYFLQDSLRVMCNLVLAMCYRPAPFVFGCTQLKVPPAHLVKLENSINISPCGVAFVKGGVRRGVLPRMLQEILDTRLMVIVFIVYIFILIIIIPCRIFQAAVCWWRLWILSHFLWFARHPTKT